MNAKRVYSFFLACLLCVGCRDPVREEATRIRNLPEQEQSEALARLPAEKRLHVALDVVQDDARHIIFDLHDEHAQTQALARFPAEKQLDIAAYGAARVEPGALLSTALAPNWKTILPALRSRLETETNESVLMEYLMTLYIISMHQCSVVDRPDILESVRRAVSRIHPPFRDLAESELRDITNPKKNLPACE